MIQRFQGSLAAAFTLIAWGLMPPSADAGLVQWVAEVNSGAPSTFLGTNISTPSIVDIGALSGDITYEFIVNGGDRSTAGTLLGSLTGGQDQAIRFEQWNDTGRYGASIFGVEDYVFNVPTTYDADIHLAFVVNAAAGTTALFVNGLATGATVPFALTLRGAVGVGATDQGGGTFLDDSFAGTIFGFAAYDSALSESELKAHSDAFFAAATPEPATWASMLLGLGIVGGVAGRRRLARSR